VSQSCYSTDDISGHTVFTNKKSTLWKHRTISRCRLFDVFLGQSSRRFVLRDFDEFSDVRHLFTDAIVPLLHSEKSGETKINFEEEKDSTLQKST
jgi:hypothetical protein